MAYLDDIITAINTDNEKDKEKTETPIGTESSGEVKKEPQDGLLTYSDEFYKEFVK